MKVSIILRRALLLCFTLTLPLSAVAYTSYLGTPITGASKPSNFDKNFIRLMRRWQMPGASVAIVKQGHVVLAHGYGWANVQERQPVYADNLFRIGSISKTITAIATLKLIQAGKLKLSDPPYRILDNLIPLNGRRINSKIYQITIGNLLNMSSGWYTSGSAAPDPMFGPWSYHMLTQIREQTPPDCETAARMMMSIPLQFRPGTQYSYSNLNYCLLGLIINKVNGQPYNYLNYQNFVNDSVLIPLGITDMHIGSTKWEERDPREVVYYPYSPYDPNPNPNGFPYSDYQATLHKNFSDGGWVASSIDLAKLFYALGQKQVLGNTMTNVMIQKPSFQRHSSHYFAYGVSVKRINRHIYWIKTGCFTGTSTIAIYQVGGTSYVALFNTMPIRNAAFLNQVQALLIRYNRQT